MRRKPGRRMKDMAKRGMVGLLTVSMCLSHVQGIAFADNRVEVGEVEVDGQKITLSLRGDSIMDAAKAAFEDAHLYENEYLGVSRDAKTQAAYRALTDGTNPLYEMNLFSEEEMQALEDAGVEVKALIQMDQEQAEAEGNLKPATESNALRATEEENTQLVVFDPKKEGKKDLLLYKQDSLFANFYDQFSNQLMNQTTTEITAADPASYEINGDEKVTFILINHADDSRTLNLKLNDATLEKGIKLPKAETVITGVMHTLDAKGIDDTTEPANPSVVPTQEATTADSTTADANASTEASTEAAATTDATEANAETQLPAESETTAAAAETLPQEGQIESENIKSEATEAAPEHKTLAETMKEALAQAVETVKETITAVEETFGVIHSEAAENEGFATESELEKETTVAAAEEKKENAKTEMDTALENERKDLLKNTKASELVDSSVASAKVLQYTLDDLSKAYWSAEIEGEYEVNVFAEKTAFDADDHVKLQLKKLDKPEEAEDGTLATTDDTLSKEQVDALRADGSYENSQSIDIRFVDEDGQEVEPKTPVKVKIKVYKDALPEDADISTMTIKHLDESTGSVQADTVASYGETANGTIKAVDEQGKKVELKSVDADTAEVADEGVEATSVAAATKEVLPEEAVGVESTFTVKSFSAFALTYDAVYNSANNVDVYYVYVEDGRCTIDGPDKIDNLRQLAHFSIDFKDVSAPKEGYIFSKVKLVRDNTKFDLDEYNSQNSFNINSELHYNYQVDWWNSYWEYKTRDANNNESLKRLEPTDKIYVIYTKLETVTTIDSQTAGFRMYMTDFGPGTDIGVFQSGGYNDGYLYKGLYSSVITDETGFPRVKENNESHSKWCVNGTEVNNLFVNKDGYYYFNSADYYAVLNKNDNNFTVYKQLGTPYNTNDFYFKRGNFMPYNPLNTTIVNNLNQYDDKGNVLSQENSRKYEALYALDGENILNNKNVTHPDRDEQNRDYYFGMYAVANFYQPVGGKVKYGDTTEDMVYEFTGDDDLVVYLDDVLVLDLGGIHDAQRGSINFATGDVKWTDLPQNASDKDVWNESTLYKQFKDSLDKAQNEGKITQEKRDSKLNKEEKWTTDNKTFADGSFHTIKFFYMERGAGASNLKLKVNIPPIPDGAIRISKEVTGLNLNQIKNETYTFQITDKNDNPISDMPYTLSDEISDIPHTLSDGKTDGTTNENGELNIPAGKTATITGITAGTEVKVREVNVSGIYTTNYAVRASNNSNVSAPVITTNQADKYVSATIPAAGSVDVTVTNHAEITRNLEIVKTYKQNGLPANSAPDTTNFSKATFTLQQKEQTEPDEKYKDLETVSLNDNRFTFEHLDPKKVYRVVEHVSVGTPSDSNPNGGKPNLPYIGTSYTVSSPEMVEGNGTTASGILLQNSDGGYFNNTVTFTNEYQTPFVNVKIEKVDAEPDVKGDYKNLAGAEFKIEKSENGTTFNQVTSGITDADGKNVTFTNEKLIIPSDGITLKLQNGVYRLTETKAPNGYNLLTEAVTFEVKNGTVINRTDGKMLVVTPPAKDSKPYTVTIMNKAGVALPVTGGTGTILFSLGGMALMLIALGYVVMKRREEGVVIK